MQYNTKEALQEFIKLTAKESLIKTSPIHRKATEVNDVRVYGEDYTCALIQYTLKSGKIEINVFNLLSDFDHKELEGYVESRASQAPDDVAKFLELEIFKKINEGKSVNELIKENPELAAKALAQGL